MHGIPGMHRMPPFCHLTLGLPRIQNFLPSTSSNEIFSGTFLFRASLRWSYHMSRSTWRLVALEFLVDHVDILGRCNLWKSFSMIIYDLTRRVIFLVQLMCCSFSRVKSQSAPIQPRPFRRELHARFDTCWSGWVWPVWSAQYVLWSLAVSQRSCPINWRTYVKQPGCWSLDPSELSEPEDWSISVTKTYKNNI